MSAPPKVLELVDLFHRNTDAYHGPQYNEAMVRQEFINPLFKCLGWDMDNEQGYAEPYKDVIHEAAHQRRSGMRFRLTAGHWGVEVSIAKKRT